MLRFLILALLIALVLWLLFGRSRKRPTGNGSVEHPHKPVSFVVCAHCGVHFPTDDAVIEGELAYCSESHRLAGPRNSG